jgi:putative Holliday junction resolvase
LAIDYGERRIGLALSDEMGIIASGAGTLLNDEHTVPSIGDLVTSRSVVRIIVGFPLTLKGEEGDAARIVQRFVDVLRNHVGVSVELVDERFTSSIAERTIRELGVSRKKRRDKGKIDEIAAVILLQGYLDTIR